MKVGALCAGYGGLEMGVTTVFPDAHLAWVFEKDAAASKVLERRFPGVPNYGDLMEADWFTLERVDIITAGFPCQDISNAGKREGIKGERSGLWFDIARGIGLLRPRYAFLENVGALRNRGLGAVLSTLHEIGYDAKWTTLRASEVGAAHHRERWFCLATPSNAYGG